MRRPVAPPRRALRPDPFLPHLLNGRPGRWPVPGAGEDALAGYLEQARALLRAAGPLAPNPGPSWLPPDLERLRDFHLPAPA
jgi:hypothetical protein